MSRTKAFKRLSTAVLSGAVIAATPFVFTGVANAATATQASLSPYAAAPGTMSYLNDGTNATIPLTVEVVQATGGDPLGAFVRFSYQQTAPVADPGYTTIATVPVSQTVDPAAPGDANTKLFATTEWAPPSGTAFNIRQELLEANGVTVIDTDTAPAVAVNNTSPTANMVLPAVGGFLPYNPTTTRVFTRGTASTGQPAGTVGFAPGGGSSAVVYDGTTANWASNPLLPGGQTPPAAAPSAVNQYLDSYVIGNFGGFGNSNGRKAVIYRQDLASFSPAPAAANKQPGVLAANQQTFVFTALDQKGNPIAGMPVDIDANDPNDNASYCVQTLDEAGTATTILGSAAAPCSKGVASVNADAAVAGVTDNFGRLRLRAFNTGTETITINVKSKFDGTYKPASDFSVNTTLVTAPQIVTSGTTAVTGSPTFSIYPSQSYGTATGPLATVTLKDQFGNHVDAAGVPVVYSVVRTITSGADAAACNDLAVYPKTFANAPAVTINAVTNDYEIRPGAAPQNLTPAGCVNTESGKDVFTIWVEANGTPGYQAGADLLVGSPTVLFGPEKIYFEPCTPDNGNAYNTLPRFDCTTGTTAGLTKTATLQVTIFDGTTYVPVTGRKVDLTLSNFPGVVGTDSGFSPTNPGLTKLTSTTGNVTTDANGKASVSVFSNLTSINPLITASDATLAGVTNEDGTLNAVFRTYVEDLDHIQTQSVRRLSPGGNVAGAVGSAGLPGRYTVEVRDSNNLPLRFETVTLNVTKGFFTPLPTTADLYRTLPFTTAPANAAKVAGDIKTLGQSITTVTDFNGNAYFAIGTLKDAGYDATGDITGDLTVGFGGKTLKVVNGGVLYTTKFTGTAADSPVQPGTLTTVEGSFANTGQFIAGSPAAKPSGDKAVANVNTIPSDTVSTIVKQTDSFGNLISSPVGVAVTGVGSLNTAAVSGSFNNDYISAATTVTNGAKIATLSNATSQNPALGASTVTATWQSHERVWNINNVLVPPAIQINDNVVNITDAYNVNWYLRGATGLGVTVKVSPSDKVVAGTPVNVAVKVTDDHSRPVKGLFVQIFRSGPQGEASQTDPITCPALCTNQLVTDANGSAGYTFLSTKVGGVAITTVVVDAAGNEVYRHVDNVTYTGFSKPKLVQSSSNGLVTFTVTVDSSFAGKSIQFFRRSGLTGKVQNLGTATVNNLGIAVRKLNLTKGGIILAYAKIEGVTGGIEDIRSSDVAFKVQ